MLSLNQETNFENYFILTTNKYLLFQNLSQISDEYVFRNFKPAAAKASAKTNDAGNNNAASANAKIGHFSATNRQSLQLDDSQLAKLKVCISQKTPALLV